MEKLVIIIESLIIGVLLLIIFSLLSKIKKLTRRFSLVKFAEKTPEKGRVIEVWRPRKDSLLDFYQLRCDVFDCRAGTFRYDGYYQIEDTRFHRIMCINTEKHHGRKEEEGPRVLDCDHWRYYK